MSGLMPSPTPRWKGWRQDHPWGVALVGGTLAYFLAERLPVIHGLVGWIVLIGMPVLWTRWSASSLITRQSPVGYAIGLGAVLGASIDLAGAILNTLFLALLSVSLASSSTLASAGAGVGAMFSLGHWVIAPFVGGFLGALGGLIGGASLPRDGV